MFIDLAYSMTNDSNPDFDQDLYDLLGLSDHSGYGFGLRDMQWEQHASTLSATEILENVKQIAGGHLAYITIGQDDYTVIVQYEAAWFQQNPVTPIPPTQGH